MAADGDRLKSSTVHQNQPFDESLDVADAEDVPSIYEPTPRAPNHSHSDTRSRGDTPPETRMSEEEYDAGRGPGQEISGRPSRPQMTQEGIPGQQYPRGEEDDEEETGSEDDDEETDEDDDDDEDGTLNVEGAYNPADYENLAVSQEIRELFQYIQRYTPQTIELEHRLRPFIPDYIPSVGDIDAFLKVPRPDHRQDGLGLMVLDEPCAKQSDPTVLDLLIRQTSKQSSSKQQVIRSIENAERHPKDVDNWINSITELHRTKPPPTVHYSRNMPDIESLMQEWPAEMEELLKEVSLPTADLDCDLATYVDLVCGLVDIPVYKNRVQSLHVLFTLFSEFKNSQHFRTLADENKLDNALRVQGMGGGMTTSRSDASQL